MLATGYDHSPFPPFHALAKTEGLEDAHDPCGHDVMLDRPDDLVQILLDAAS